MKTFLLIIILCLSSMAKGSSYKLYGAEISCKYVSGTTYTVNIVAYGSCINTFPGMSPIRISDGSPSQVYYPSVVGHYDMTPVASGQCDICTYSKCGLNFGFQKIVATASFDLNDFSGCNLTIAWSQCCTDTLSNMYTAANYLYVSCKLNACYKKQNGPTFIFNPVMAVNISHLVNNYEMVKPGNSADSVYYQLVSPQDVAGNDLLYNSPFNYKEPVSYSGKNRYAKKPDGFHFDSLTGEWCFKPSGVESAYMSYEAVEYAKDASGKYYLAGSTMRTQMIKVLNNAYHSYPLAINRTDGSNSDTIYGCSNAPINFSIKGYKVGQEVNGDSITISEYNETPQPLSYSKKYTDVFGNFSWTPGNSDVRKKPYRIILTITDKTKPIINSLQRSFYIIVKDTLPSVFLTEGTDAGCGKYAFKSLFPFDPGQKITYKWYFDSTLISTSSAGNYQSSLCWKASYPVNHYQ